MLCAELGALTSEEGALVGPEKPGRQRLHKGNCVQVRARLASGTLFSGSAAGCSRAWPRPAFRPVPGLTFSCPSRHLDIPVQWNLTRVRRGAHPHHIDQ